MPWEQEIAQLLMQGGIAALVIAAVTAVVIFALPKMLQGIVDRFSNELQRQREMLLDTIARQEASHQAQIHELNQAFEQRHRQDRELAEERAHRIVAATTELAAKIQAELIELRRNA